jgi:ADP-ribose pyrophosphatase YjhB (NUDIX family)
MAKHRQNGEEWWCLPGGGIQDEESPAEAAIRELKEECCIDGTIIRETGVVVYSQQDKAYTFVIDVGIQEPRLGTDPEYQQQVLVDLKWLKLSEIPEQDRVVLWAAGLSGVGDFLEEVSSWGAAIRYPQQEMGK